MNVVGVLLTFVCITWTVTSAETSDPGHCAHPLPGSDRLMQGVDLKTLDMYDSKIFKRNVMKRTCFLKKTADYIGETYDIPDQIESWTQNSEGSFDTTATVIESLEDLSSTFSVGVSVEASYGPVSGSASVSYQKMKQDIAENKHFYTIVEASKKTATIFLHVPPHPRMEMTYTANHSLPWGLDYKLGTQGNENKYLQWIKRYGTHLFEKGHFGAVIRSVSKTESSLKDKYSEEDLKAAARVAYNGLVASAAVEVSAGKSSKSMTSDFNKHSETTIQYYGGEANLMTEKGLEEWSDTVRANPYLQTGKLMPIYSIIEDGHMREQMKMAVDDYLSSMDLESRFLALTNQVTNQIATQDLLKTCVSRRVGFMAVISSAFSGNIAHIRQNQRVVFDRVRYSSGDSYNGHTGLFTCRVAGVYQFNIYAVNAPNHDIVLRLRLNSQVITTVHTHDPKGPDSGSSGAVVHLNQNDVVDVVVADGHDAQFFKDQNVVKSNVFTGQLVHSDDCVF